MKSKVEFIYNNTSYRSYLNSFMSDIENLYVKTTRGIDNYSTINIDLEFHEDKNDNKDKFENNIILDSTIA